MSNGPYYQGGCTCGAVTLIVTALPLARGSDAQGQKWLVLDADCVQFSAGLEALESDYPAGRVSHRCRHCEGHVVDELGASSLALLQVESLPAMEDIEAPLPDALLACRLPWSLD